VTLGLAETVVPSYSAYRNRQEKEEEEEEECHEVSIEPF